MGLTAWAQFFRREPNVLPAGTAIEPQQLWENSGFELVELRFKLF